MMCLTVNNLRRGVASLLALGLLATAWHVSATEPLLKQGQARVVLVGDSITGLSRNYATGFAHQMDWALAQAYPGCRPNLVALGGSGQGVRSWRDVELRSRAQKVLLDVPGIDVQAALAQPADALVMMLGMNDVLAPYVVDEPATLDEWKANYRELIAALQSRLHPQVTVLANATLCTEDIASPKNRMLDKLNAQAASLAKELDLLWVPTNEAMRDVLQQGRRLQPDFHVTYDYVHPNEPGHIAIAIAMLRGLGEEAAAKAIAEQRLPQALEKSAGVPPRLSFEVKPLPTPLKEERQSFRIHYWLTGLQGSGGPSPQVTLAGDPWDVTPAAIEAPEGEFAVSGTPNQRENILRLTATVGSQSVSRDVRFSPPWLVAAGFIAPFWNGQTLDTVKARGPVDEAIAAGRDFTAEADAGGRQPQWLRVFPSADYTGGAAPGSVDFAAVTHARNFEAGYGARWIRSDRERTANLALSTQAFAGTNHLTVYLNGREVYSGLLTGEPEHRKTVEVRLTRGWNTLAFRSNHVTWQWQCAVDFKPAGEDSLDDLRYSIVPRTPGWILKVSKEKEERMRVTTASLLLLSCALLADRLEAGEAPAAPQRLTARQVIERIRENVHCDWSEKTVDTFKSGDPDTPVTGVATTFLATLDVLKRAVASGKNLVITHEPTFYNHFDDTQRFEGDEVVAAKQAYLKEHGIIIFRFHDHWHKRRPDGIIQGMTERFGWGQYRDREDPSVYHLPETTAERLAGGLAAKFKTRTIRVVGNSSMKCGGVALVPGASGSAAQIRMLQRADVQVVLAGETPEWETVEYVRDAVAAGKQKCLILLGHANSEEAGMEYCARWLKTFIPEVPIEFIPAGDPFWTP